jgi:hypothetical protein
LLQITRNFHFWNIKFLGVGISWFSFKVTKPTSVSVSGTLSASPACKYENLLLEFNQIWFETLYIVNVKRRDIRFKTPCIEVQGNKSTLSSWILWSCDLSPGANTSRELKLFWSITDLCEFSRITEVQRKNIHSYWTHTHIYLQNYKILLPFLALAIFSSFVGN